MAAEQAAEASAARRQRLRLLGGVALAAAVIVVIVIAVSSGGSAKPKPKVATGKPPQGVATVAREFAGIPQQGLTLGDPKAPVTLVEFADLKCPTCQFYSLNILPTLLKDYVRTGKVKMEFRQMAFVGEAISPGDSPAAARMSMAVSLQSRTWQFAELFYINQQDENTRYVTDAFLRHIGSGVAGLDIPKALAARTSSQVRGLLATAEAQFKASGFTGTPSFLLGRSDSPPPAFNPSSFSLDAFTGPIDALLKGR